MVDRPDVSEAVVACATLAWPSPPARASVASTSRGRAWCARDLQGPRLYVEASDGPRHHVWVHEDAASRGQLPSADLLDLLTDHLLATLPCDLCAARLERGQERAACACTCHVDEDAARVARLQREGLLNR